MSYYSAELPYQADAAHYYAMLADLPWTAWLDSGGMGRYDILTAVPRRTLSLHRDVAHGEPFALLRNELAKPVAPVANVPFAGGALGYWGYDLALHMLETPRDEQNDGQLPDIAVGIYDWALVLDHQQQTARLVSHRRGYCNA